MPSVKSASRLPKKTEAERTLASEPVTTPAAPARLFIGTSGWAYPSWKPGFYPPALPTKKFLGYYASRLNSCEVNYSFRKLPSADQLAGWMAQTGEGFRFSFKAPQGITHFSRLRACETEVAALLDCLNPVAKAGKLGQILFQLPPNFKADHARLADFLAIKRLRGRTAPRIAFEFRHASWFTDETARLLGKFGASYCIAETDDLVTPEVHTAPRHTSFRLRRAGGYTPAEVDAFAQRLLALTGDRDVYAYFKHEDGPTGALNASACLGAAAALARAAAALGSEAESPAA